MVITALRITLFTATIFPISACDISLPKNNSPLFSYTLVLKSSNAAGGTEKNECYADLDGGVIFDLAAAKANDSKVDLKYSYIAGNGNYRRVLYPMEKRYFPELNNIELSYFAFSDSFAVSDAEFDEIRTAGDIDKFMNTQVIPWCPGAGAHICDGPEDKLTKKIFPFITNGGTKKGLLKVEPYDQRPAADSEAFIILRVKIQP